MSDEKVKRLSKEKTCESCGETFIRGGAHDYGDICYKCTEAKISGELTEGMTKKGGMNDRPTTPPPPEPKGQGGVSGTFTPDLEKINTKLMKEARILREENVRLKTFVKIVTQGFNDAAKALTSE